ncbi:unnamed protein product [Leptosia nina]|uniref:Uncharacterized protein n=1 Tax=Leptosia nina TaxID=320188 RepID=A0AAV1J344_9NEOP
MRYSAPIIATIISGECNRRGRYTGRSWESHRPSGAGVRTRRPLQTRLCVSPASIRAYGAVINPSLATDP